MQQTKGVSHYLNIYTKFQAWLSGFGGAVLVGGVSLGLNADPWV